MLNIKESCGVSELLSIFTDNVITESLLNCPKYTIIDYSFLYNDTTVLNILTFIDSTFLSATDSSWLANADSSWSLEGVLASDSIIVYFGQFNNDSVITLSVNIDSTSLTPQDSLMFNTSDSSWIFQSVIGNIDTLRTYYGQFSKATASVSPQIQNSFWVFNIF